jgi:uncharacterized protein (TIGR02594 family)
MPFTPSASEPSYLTAARRDIGLREVKGPKHAGRIVQMLQRLGAWWRDDETPWCGVAVASWLSEAGYPIPKHYYRALAWADYGDGLALPRQGAIAVLTRKGGGHVALVTGATPDYKHVRLLGGNQGDAVSEAWFPASRITAYRVPPGASLAVWVASAKVGTLSKSEA